jgi:hypothetical protein
MAGGVNVPVLVGVIPLFSVTQFTLTEGYKTVQLAGSRLTQLTTPSERKMVIEATLVGSKRLLIKKGLEAVALTSRALAVAAAPLMALAGVPVVSGLVISLDMQVTELNFIQNNKQRDAIDARITLVQVPRSSISMIVGEALDVALAVGVAFVPTVSDMVPLKRQFGG